MLSLARHFHKLLPSQYHPYKAWSCLSLAKRSQILAAKEPWYQNTKKFSSFTAMSTPEPLPNPQRVITDTDLETGISHFNTTLDESLAVKQDLGGSLFRLGYITDKTPNTLDGTDLTNYTEYLETASVPPVTLPDGRGMIWYIDTPPGKGSPSHRTLSFDVVIQVAGEIELTLESGEKRIQKPGDMVIQRATTHSWRNPSEDKWARMVGVMYSSNPVVLKNGTELGPSGL